MDNRLLQDWTGQDSRIWRIHDTCANNGFSMIQATDNQGRGPAGAATISIPTHLAVSQMTQSAGKGALTNEERQKLAQLNAIMLRCGRRVWLHYHRTVMTRSHMDHADEGDRRRWMQRMASTQAGHGDQISNGARQSVVNEAITDMADVQAGRADQPQDPHTVQRQNLQVTTEDSQSQHQPDNQAALDGLLAVLQTSQVAETTVAFRSLASQIRQADGTGRPGAYDLQIARKNNSANDLSEASSSINGILVASIETVQEHMKPLQMEERSSFMQQQKGLRTTPITRRTFETLHGLEGSDSETTTNTPTRTSQTGREQPDTEAVSGCDKCIEVAGRQGTMNATGSARATMVMDNVCHLCATGTEEGRALCGELSMRQRRSTPREPRQAGNLTTGPGVIAAMSITPSPFTQPEPRIHATTMEERRARHLRDDDSTALMQRATQVRHETTKRGPLCDNSQERQKGNTPSREDNATTRQQFPATSQASSSPDVAAAQGPLSAANAARFAAAVRLMFFDAPPGDPAHNPATWDLSMGPRVSRRPVSIAHRDSKDPLFNNGDLTTLMQWDAQVRGNPHRGRMEIIHTRRGEVTLLQVPRHNNRQRLPPLRPEQVSTITISDAYLYSDGVQGEYRLCLRLVQRQAQVIQIHGTEHRLVFDVQKWFQETLLHAMFNIQRPCGRDGWWTCCEIDYFDEDFQVACMRHIDVFGNKCKLQNPMNAVSRPIIWWWTIEVVIAAMRNRLEGRNPCLVSVRLGAGMTVCRDVAGRIRGRNQEQNELRAATADIERRSAAHVAAPTHVEQDASSSERRVKPRMSVGDDEEHMVLMQQVKHARRGEVQLLHVTMNNGKPRLPPLRRPDTLDIVIEEVDDTSDPIDQLTGQNDRLLRMSQTQIQALQGTTGTLVFDVQRWFDKTLLYFVVDIPNCYGRDRTWRCCEGDFSTDNSKWQVFMLQRRTSRTGTLYGGGHSRKSTQRLGKGCMGAILACTMCSTDQDLRS